jgi:hypothetical protein
MLNLPSRHSITSSARASTLVGISMPAPIVIDVIRPTASDKGAFEVDRRQFVPGRKRDDQLMINVRQGAPGHDQTAVRGAREVSKGVLDLSRHAG